MDPGAMLAGACLVLALSGLLTIMAIISLFYSHRGKRPGLVMGALAVGTGIVIGTLMVCTGQELSTTWMLVLTPTILGGISVAMCLQKRRGYL